MHEAPHLVVAATIRAEMARKRETQTRMAPKLGMSQSSLSKRIRGEVPFSIPEITNVATLLDIPVASLLDVGQRAGYGQHDSVSGTAPAELPSRQERVDGLAADVEGES